MVGHQLLARQELQIQVVAVVAGQVLVGQAAALVWLVAQA